MKQIAKKWYDRIGFPQDCDAEFQALLAACPEIDKGLTAEQFAPEDLPELAAKNLLTILFLCESAEAKYRERGIPEKIMQATLSDILNWVGIYRAHTGKLGIASPLWMTNHLTARLFKLGRLQFCRGTTHEPIPALGICKNAPCLDIHIPAGEPLSREACLASLRMAREFFPAYFPEFDFKCFVCHSWLLDDTLRSFLGEDSNIIRFQKLFTPLTKNESEAILRYTVDWYATRETLHTFPKKGRLAEKVAAEITRGTVFYETLGYIEK